MHCPFHISNEQHGELLFCRSERARLFSAVLKRGIGISQWDGDNGPQRCWVAHAGMHRALFPISAAAPAVTRTLWPSVTVWRAAWSHIAYRCPRKEKRSLPSAFLQLGLFLKRKIHSLDEIPWNWSFNPEVSNTRLLQSYLDPHAPTLLFIHQIFYIFTSVIKRQKQNFSPDFHFSKIPCSSSRAPAVWLLTQL